MRISSFDVHWQTESHLELVARWVAAEVVSEKFCEGLARDPLRIGSERMSDGRTWEHSPASVGHLDGGSLNVLGLVKEVFCRDRFEVVGRAFGMCALGSANFQRQDFGRWSHVTPHHDTTSPQRHFVRSLGSLG